MAENVLKKETYLGKGRTENPKQDETKRLTARQS